MSTILLKRPCPMCGKVNTIEVELAGYARWQNGELVQNAFPDMCADDREMVLTGICCWDEQFPDE